MVSAVVKAELAKVTPVYTALASSASERQSLYWQLERAGRINHFREALAADASLAEFNRVGNMRFVANSGSQAGIDDLARWLAERAAGAGVDRTITDLERYLAEPDFPCRFVTGILAATVSTPLEVAPGVMLVPFTRQQLGVHYQQSYHVGTPIDRMKAALEINARHPKVYKQQPIASHPPELLAQMESAFTRMEIARQCLGLVKPSPSVAIIQICLLPEDVPLWSSSGGIFTQTPASMIHFEDYLFSADEAETARHIVGLYVRSTAQLRSRISIAIHRLHAGLSRYGTVDGAIDLGIALEALFLPDANAELTYRLRMRGGRLLGRNKQERLRVGRELQKIYDARSVAVHTGALPKKSGIDGFTSVPELLLHGFTLVARAAVAVMEHDIHDWDDFMMS